MFDNCPRCNSPHVKTKRTIEGEKVNYLFSCKKCEFSLLTLSLPKTKDKIKRDIELLTKKIEQSGDIRLINILEKRVEKYGRL